MGLGGQGEVLACVTVIKCTLQPNVDREAARFDKAGLASPADNTSFAPSLLTSTSLAPLSLTPPPPLLGAPHLFRYEVEQLLVMVPHQCIRAARHHELDRQCSILHTSTRAAFSTNRGGSGCQLPCLAACPAGGVGCGGCGGCGFDDN